MQPSFLEKLFSPFYNFFSFYFGRLNPEAAFQGVSIINIIAIMPVIGYGIFFVYLFEFPNILFPLQLSNPAWELQTIGALMNQSWALLIGMGFICSRYFTENHKDTLLIEFLLLKFLRWFFLILAILYLFLAPPVVLNSFKISTQITEQVAQQQNAKITEIDQIQNQSSKITNPSQLRALAQSLNINKDDIARLSDERLSATIQQLFSNAKSRIEKESAIARRNQLQKLWQNCTRIVFSQVLLAFNFIFIFIWSKFSRLGKLDMAFFFSKLNPETAFQQVLTINIIAIMPVIGYGIFFTSLTDFLNTLFPLQFFNPDWELQTIGTLISQSCILLIGMGFICSRYFTENQKDARFIEFLLLKFLRWFFLILAILYLFLAPLVVLNSFRMTTQIRQQVAQKQNATITEIDKIQNQSSKITNSDQLRALAQSININALAKLPNINKVDITRLSDKQLPDSIQQQLSVVKSQIKKEAAIARRNQLQKLWQNSIRMIFSQILLAFTFIIIWSKFGRLGKLKMTAYEIED
jgi:hypothetical protein